jgi:hypothetical protein
LPPPLDERRQEDESTHRNEVIWIPDAETLVKRAGARTSCSGEAETLRPTGIYSRVSARLTSPRYPRLRRRGRATHG